MSGHDCPVSGCAVKNLPHHILMCAPHWSAVPSALRKDLNRAWHGGADVGEYLRLRSECIKSVEEGWH